jgi:hypothetical protein
MAYLSTGQQSCYDVAGHEIDCIGSGQDAEFKNGCIWPSPRFILRWEIVEDQLTGLYWTRQANFAQFPLTWQEALEYVQEMNRQNMLGYHDWHLPNRKELRSLMSYQTRKPALPAGHPFTDVFQSWYWTSTTAAISPKHAWTVHLEGARMFYGGKDQSYLLWPVRGTARSILAVTGQQDCYDDQGKRIHCSDTGQDSEYQSGHAWPQPRFSVTTDGLEDGLTHLCWYRNANLTHTPVTWQKALQAIHQLNQHANAKSWRLPNINELESLVDCARRKPALPQQAVFDDVQDAYWSSTTSVFEPDWAWALYLDKGAIGVGQKRDPHFFVWPVSDGS